MTSGDPGKSDNETASGQQQATVRPVGTRDLLHGKVWCIGR
jgi:hypothetical protein